MQKEITLNDILLIVTEIKGNMLTKEDSKKFATKEDIKEIKEELEQHKKILEQHTKTLDQHTKTLDQHTKTLEQHTKTLEQHTKTLEQHTKILEQHTKDIKKIKRDVSEINFVINGLADDIGMLDVRTRDLVVYEKSKKDISKFVMPKFL